MPTAENEIEFSAENGRLLGTSNGNPADHTPAHSGTRRAFGGLAQVVVEYEGGAAVSAVSGTLAPAALRL